MKIYIEATNGIGGNATPSQWAGSYPKGLLSTLYKLWTLWTCPYKYRSFRIEVNNPKKKQNA